MKKILYPVLFSLFVSAGPIALIMMFDLSCSPPPEPKPETSIKDQANLLVKLIEIDRILKERQARIDVLEKENAKAINRVNRCEKTIQLHEMCPNAERFFEKCYSWNSEVSCICGNDCDDDRPCSWEMTEYYQKITELGWRRK